MPKETPNLEPEAPAAPVEGGESDDQKEFDKLFEGIDLEDESVSPEVKETVERLQKEAHKFFSQKGMEKKPVVVTPEPAEKKEDMTDLETVFFESKPEADLVKDDLKQIAEAKGLTLIQAWKNESWLQDKAKALHAEKVETEKNKGRVGDPSSTFGGERDSETIARENSFIANLPPGFSAKKQNS